MPIDNEVIDSIADLVHKIDPESQQYQLVVKVLNHFKEILDNTGDIQVGEIESLHDDLENKFRKMPLIMEIGSIIRRFYSQFQEVKNEIMGKLRDVKDDSLLPATKRLQHVVEMTEKAANKTLDLSESILDSIFEESGQKTDLITTIEKALAEGADANQKEEILKQTLTFLQQSKEKDEDYNQKLTDILLAQDYQDLTGQVIGKIITLIETMETDLLSLMEKFQISESARLKAIQQAKEAAEVAAAQAEVEPEHPKMEGPLQPEIGDRQSQSEVDRLLAEMGFG